MANMRDGTWLNEPTTWSETADTLEVVTDGATDFWCETHYGFTRDSGHFRGVPAPAAFTAQLRVRAAYESLYDQAGIMIRLDERRWVKAGIELSDGRAMLSSVLTQGCSDWATAPYEGDAVGSPAAQGRQDRDHHAQHASSSEAKWP